MSIPGVSSKRATFLSKLAARCRLSAESEVQPGRGPAPASSLFLEVAGRGGGGGGASRWAREWRLGDLGWRISAGLTLDTAVPGGQGAGAGLLGVHGGGGGGAPHTGPDTHPQLN